MKKRMDALVRISRLQASLHRLNRARVTMLEQERASLSDEVAAVMEALTSGALAYGGQARLGSRHVHALEARIEAVMHEESATRGKALSQGVRAKLAEQAAGTALARYRDQKERKELVDLIDRALARRRASST
jgi:hypothetical protein